ncbi:MAG: glycosyl transferase [Chloroflexi bacterium RBG_19FT_COMBO_62_14]|nr:MAG: glycosyl transferase [Chloroflexi bacterium RBG_19FT_COMBO_62_14]
MQIAMISYHTCPLATLGGKDTGGMNVYIRDLTRELGRRGVGVDVFTRSQDEHVPHVLHDLGYGNRIVHIPAGPESPVAKTELLGHLDRFVEGVLDFASAKQSAYDLIHSHYWLSGLAALTLRRAWGTPIIQMFHTLGEMKNRVARSPEETASPLRLESEGRLLRDVDRVVAATQAELAQIQWLYRADTSRVTVIPPGVDIARFYPIDKDEAKEFVGIARSDRMILYVGRVEPLKGLDTLLQAIAQLKAEGLQDVCGVISVIGGEPDASPEQMTTEMGHIKSLRESLDLDDMITFLGKRDQDTLQYYYSAAEVVVVPSHYESFGLVALEAMACGTPVVASETGGLVFLVRDGETGFHVPAGDAPALADRLRRLLLDEELRQRLGHRAADYAQSYAWPLVADQVIALYESMLNRHA